MPTTANLLSPSSLDKFSHHFVSDKQYVEVLIFPEAGSDGCDKSGGCDEKTSFHPESPPGSPGTQPSDFADSDLASCERGLLNDREMPEKKTWVYLVMLTICLGGLQIAFSIQFATGTNYLLALEISPTLVGVVWLVPPICGALLQPCFGFWSDHCSSRLGKRKPFIIGGGIGLSIFLFGFAWTLEVSHAFAGLFGSTSCSASDSTCTMTKLLAAFFILGINVSAQAIQSGARALIVDLCPSHLQLQVNAWASRISNIASIFLYLASCTDLPRLMPFWGNTQLKSLSVLGSFTLLITLGITCLGMPNAASTSDDIRRERSKPYNIFKQLRIVITTLPSQINRIHLVQFFSWFAWFPFMVYISSYVGKSNLASIISQDTKISAAEMALETETSGRYGALSLFSLSLSALITSTVLPSLLSRIYAIGRLCSSSKLSWYQRAPFYWLTYRNVWFVSQIIYSLGIFGILLTKSSILMIFIVGLMGFSWAVTQWIPFTLINMAIIDMEGSSVYESNGSHGRVGTVLGVHNVFIAAPQILASLACTVIFEFVGGQADDAAVHGISWIFAGCGLTSLVAAVMVLRMADIHR